MAISTRHLLPLLACVGSFLSAPAAAVAQQEDGHQRRDGVDHVWMRGDESDPASDDQGDETTDEVPDEAVEEVSAPPFVLADEVVAPERRARFASGRAVAPPGAPPAVRAAIAAANRIADRPYRWGGGHASFSDSGYDCSGAVSYVLRSAGRLSAPLASGGLARWGAGGSGRWITVYANDGHTFMTIAGLRFDTGMRDPAAVSLGAVPGSGPRWGGPRPIDGFAVRHPVGL
jgi:hypothetical protein